MGGLYLKRVRLEFRNLSSPSSQPSHCARGGDVDSLLNTQRFRLERDGPTGLPLPQGEGWDEGEGSLQRIEARKK
jgi:hypothetical protein